MRPYVELARMLIHEASISKFRLTTVEVVSTRESHRLERDAKVSVCVCMWQELDIKRTKTS